MEIHEKLKLEGKRLGIFLLLTAIFLAILSGIYFQVGHGEILMLLMLTPTLAVIITRLVTREGWHDLLLHPHFRGNIRWYLFSYLATPVISYLGAGLFFLLMPQLWDPLGSYFARSIEATSMGDYLGMLATVAPLAALVNPLFGLVTCLGEEFAWRGYLFPKLCKQTSVLKATLISSIIWGIWHAPIIVTGFNYGTDHPVWGCLAQVGFCLVLGGIFSWLTLRVNSIWPAVVMHASINGLDKIKPSDLLMSQSSNPFIGPDLIGIIGGAGLIVVSILCYRKLWKLSTIDGDPCLN